MNVGDHEGVVFPASSWPRIPTLGEEVLIPAPNGALPEQMGVIVIVYWLHADREVQLVLRDKV